MTKEEKAHIAPFVAFMAGLLLIELINKVSEGEGPFWLASPQYWVFPVQTIVCGALLWHWRGLYHFLPLKNVAWTLFVAALVFGIWIAPQEMLGFPRRESGFNPDVFAGSSALYWTTLTFRFVRLVIVVPLLEEIFWRGFLLRYLIDPHFERIPFGSFQLKSFAIVSVLFAFAHFGPDFWPALITGVLYNSVAVTTRSLGSCVLAHAVTNLLLGIYIMATRQWGFW